MLKVLLCLLSLDEKRSVTRLARNDMAAPAVNAGQMSLPVVLLKNTKVPFTNLINA